jgi:hypothetical protein
VARTGGTLGGGGDGALDGSANCVAAEGSVVLGELERGELAVGALTRAEKVDSAPATF